MAELNLTAKVRLVPDDETMQLILILLNLWQDANPDMMVAMVPQKDRYGYEIIDRSGKHDEMDRMLRRIEAEKTWVEEKDGTLKEVK